MPLVIADRVKETTTTTGTGTITLAGAASGFRSFSVVGNGNTTYYAIVDPVSGAWETGIGTYSTTGPTLARTTVLQSSNSNALVNFGSGSKEVFVTYPAARSVFSDGFNASGSWGISISGNAATVTNGVYTSGSYADPAWITSLAGSKVSGNITGNAANVTGTVAVANGGTGATDAGTARTNLGLAIGSNVQAYSANLATIAGLSPTADNFIVGNGTTWTLETPAQARASLGATTVGGNLLTLTNPSAITFPRFNADNTVSALDAATFRSAIGAGTGDVTLTGSETLSNKTLTLPRISGSPSTTLGVIGISGTRLWHGTATTFVQLLTSGDTIGVANGGTGLTTLTANNVLLGNGTSALQAVAPGSSGNVLTSNGTTWTSAAPSAGGGTTVVEYTNMNNQWTVPSGVKAVRVQLWGGGGGGGGGRRGATSTTRLGGGGGGGGGYAERTYFAADLPAAGTVIAVNVGPGGSSVPGRTTDDTDGFFGQSGSSTTFGSNTDSWSLVAGAGTGGQPGTSGSPSQSFGRGGSGGAALDDIATTIQGHFAGGKGSNSGSTAAGGGAWGGGAGGLAYQSGGGTGNMGGGSLMGGGGGGAGAGLRSDNFTSAAAMGGSYVQSAGGSAGSAGVNGGNGSSRGGGGGGGVGSAAAAGNGGNGAFPGGGGGGGGASLNGFTGGGGGAGAWGLARITWWS